MTKIAKPAAGASLIGLMVGLALSMIAVMSMLTIAKQALRAVFGQEGIVANAVHDADAQSAMLTAQLALQEAGFGMPNAQVNHQLVILQQASVGPSGVLSGQQVLLQSEQAVGNGVLWSSAAAVDDGAATGEQCGALVADAATQTFYLLKAEACSGLAANWHTFVWTPYVLATGLDAPVQFALQRAVACWPFGAPPSTITGMPSSEGRVQVDMTFPDRSDSVGGAKATLCLTNLVVS